MIEGLSQNGRRHKNQCEKPVGLVQWNPIFDEFSMFMNICVRCFLKFLTIINHNRLQNRIRDEKLHLRSYSQLRRSSSSRLKTCFDAQNSWMIMDNDDV